LIGGLARAGKSYSAQILKELLSALGRQAHVISLDGWLKPKAERSAIGGVHHRYDLAAASIVLTEAALSNSRNALRELLYDRVSRSPSSQSVVHSIGPDDVLIVEGVPALLVTDLLNIPKLIKVYIDIPDDMRSDRLKKDYAWRGTLHADQAATMNSRELDETPMIELSKKDADYVVSIHEHKKSNK
jgi:uridine kinase